MNPKQSKRKKDTPGSLANHSRGANHRAESGLAERLEAAEEAGAAKLSGTRAVPSIGARTWLSIFLCIHLPAVFLSFAGVVEPSSLHARISALVQPYLMVTHFSADDRPVYLAHGVESEQPHRLQITSDKLFEINGERDCRWQTVGMGNYLAEDCLPGLAVSDRVARWLATAAMLAENEQPGVVAELLLPIAEHFTEANAIRIVRYPTDLNDINVVPSSPYLARIDRSDDAVSLIQLTPRRLSSQARNVSLEPIE